MTRRALGDALRSFLWGSRFDMDESAEKLIRLHTEAGEAKSTDARCRKIATDVATENGTTLAKLRARDRDPAIVDMKHQAAWRCRQLPNPPSYPRIAKALGYLNHASAIYGVRRHQARLDERAKQVSSPSVDGSPVATTPATRGSPRPR